MDCTSKCDSNNTGTDCNVCNQKHDSHGFEKIMDELEEIKEVQRNMSKQHYEEGRNIRKTHAFLQEISKNAQKSHIVLQDTNNDSKELTSLVDRILEAVKPTKAKKIYGFIIAVTVSVVAAFISGLLPSPLPRPIFGSNSPVVLSIPESPTAPPESEPTDEESEMPAETTPEPEISKPPPRHEVRVWRGWNKAWEQIPVIWGAFDDSLVAMVPLSILTNEPFDDEPLWCGETNTFIIYNDNVNGRYVSISLSIGNSHADVEIDGVITTVDMATFDISLALSYGTVFPITRSNHVYLPLYFITNTFALDVFKHDGIYFFR